MKVGQGRLHTLSIVADGEPELEINSPLVGTNSYFSLLTVPEYVNQKALRQLRLWRRKNHEVVQSQQGHPSRSYFMGKGMKSGDRKGRTWQGEKKGLNPIWLSP